MDDRSAGMDVSRHDPIGRSHPWAGDETVNDVDAGTDWGSVIILAIIVLAVLLGIWWHNRDGRGGNDDW